MSIQEHSGGYLINLAIWKCPEFTGLDALAQLVWLSARCRDGRRKITYEMTRERTNQITVAEYEKAVADLRATKYGRVLDGRVRRDIPARIRDFVMARDGYQCVNCRSQDDLCLDHIHPFSQGGKDTVNNFQVMCRPCNSRKGARV